MLGAFFVSLAAAASNATSNVLQRGAHIDALSENNQAFSLKFLLGVIRRPRWLLGIITMIASFILQAFGLAMSSLAVVQPLIVLELPFALLGAGLFLKEELTSREWTGATLMFCGVLVFVVMLDPSPGNPLGSVGTRVGAISMVVTLLIIAVLYVVSLRFGSRIKTALLGLAAGVGFGLTAVVIKDMTARIGAHGFFSIFSSWQVYIMALFGILSVYLFQYALASGRLMYAQPGVTLADPFIAIIWGLLVYNENIRGGIYILFALIGVAMTAAGVFILSRSPALKAS